VSVGINTVYIVLCEYNTVETMLKRHFMAVIDGMFCLDACVIYKHEMLSVIMLEWSEITWTYNTADTTIDA